MKKKIKKSSISAIKKRIFHTSNGYKRWHSNTSHLKAKKNSKTKRHLRRKTLLSKDDWKRLKQKI